LSSMGDPEVTDEGAEGSCPDAEQLVALARGKLADEDRQSVVGHVQGCAECSEVMRLWTRGRGDPSSLGSSADPKGSAMAVSDAEKTLGYPPGPGDVLAGKYRVERVLGIGGMGVVVAATHLQLGRIVALKLMLPTTHGSVETAARFIQEARAASEVQSEHVVRVLDVGALDDGSPFMVMEFLRGNDFARLLRTHGPLPIKDVAGYILQACEAVAEAHALGIVHRDLKPANLFLTTRADGSPLVKVLDFGISKLTRSGGSASLTKSQTTMGTPLYMSPEQLRSTRSVGPGTDIWALGCILYELLAGRPAFFAPSAEALGALIATGPAPKIRDVRPEVPIALEEAILGCLEKDPGQRLGSLGELARRIGPFAPVDVASLVARVERISAGQPERLPFADTINSERPPRFAGTAAGLARSGSTTAGRQRATRALWIAGALALGVAGLTLSRVVMTRSAAAAASAAPLTSAAPLEAPMVSAAQPTASAVVVSAPLDASVDAAPAAPAPATAASIAAPSSKKPPLPSKAKPSDSASSPKSPSPPRTNDRDAIE
jgi:eukaryotic-like serine/threonine-protein kinase